MSVQTTAKLQSTKPSVTLLVPVAWAAIAFSLYLAACKTNKYSKERLTWACEEIKKSGVDPLREQDVASCARLCDDYRVASACEREGENLARGALIIGEPAIVEKGRQYILKACSVRGEPESSCEALQRFDRTYRQSQGRP